MKIIDNEIVPAEAKFGPDSWLMDGPWDVRIRDLRYMLGEIGLFRARFRMQMLDRHWTEFPLNIDMSALEIPPADPEVEAVLLRSCPLAMDLPRLTLLKNTIRYVPTSYPRYFLRFSGSFEEYLASMTRSNRYNLQRQARRFAGHCGGAMDVREYTQVGQMEEFHRHARSVACETYQERLLHVGIPDGAAAIDELRKMASKDMVRAYTMHHQGRPLAYIYFTLRKDVLLTMHMGYDRKYHVWSPGTVLTHAALEKLFRESGRRFTMMDFGQGAGLHKARFATDSVQCADIYYFRKSASNYLLAGMHARLGGFSSLAGRVLKSLGMKAKIKSLLRNGRIAADAMVVYLVQLFIC